MRTTIARARTADRIAAASEDRLPPLLRGLLAVEILVAYVIMRRRMPRHDLRTLVSMSRGAPHRVPADGAANPPDSWRVALRLGNAVDRTLSVLPTDSRCLVQSLVLTRLLSARGVPSTLVIGAHSTPQFEAHAWVEYQGRAVLPPGDFLESRLHEL
jgi:transglutaminase superfamily protein